MSEPWVGRRFIPRGATSQGDPQGPVPAHLAPPPGAPATVTPRIRPKRGQLTRPLNRTERLCRLLQRTPDEVVKRIIWGLATHLDPWRIQTLAEEIEAGKTMAAAYDIAAISRKAADKVASALLAALEKEA